MSVHCLPGEHQQVIVTERRIGRVYISEFSPAIVTDRIRSTTVRYMFTQMSEYQHLGGGCPGQVQLGGVP